MDENNIENPEKNPQKITIVSGDGKDLEISDVHDHLNIDQTFNDHNDDKNIVIPPDNSSNK